MREGGEVREGMEKEKGKDEEKEDGRGSPDEI